jgi:hypothetical protein
MNATASRASASVRYSFSSEILLLVRLLRAAQDAGAVEVAVRAAEEAEELVEAALLRVELRGGAEVPLADQPGGVAGGLQTVGQRRLRCRQAGAALLALLPLAPGGVEFVAEALLVAAGQQAGAGRRTVRARDVAVGEPRPGLGQRVEVRRRHVLAAVEAHVGVAEVVGQDDDDVRLARLVAGPEPGRGEQPRGDQREQVAWHRFSPSFPFSSRRGKARPGTAWPTLPTARPAP